MFNLFASPITIGVILAFVAIVILALIIAKRYRIATPDEAIIVTGRKGKGGDTASQKVVTGGGVFVLPLLQKSFRLSLRSRQLSIETEAQTRNGITIQARAIAIVKVGSSEEDIRAAAQRFLTQQDDIERSAQEVLSGSLRGVVGSLTVEEIIRDRSAVASAVLDAAGDALSKQGLSLDTLQIQEIKDKEDYIKNLGRPEAAAVVRKAKIADIEAAKEAENAKIDAQKVILERNRELKLRQAEIQQETDKAQAEADATKPREEAIQRQQIVDAEEITAQKQALLTEAELKGTVNKQADAEAYKMKVLAEAAAEAEASRARGQARAEIAEAEAAKQKRVLSSEALEAEGQAERNSRMAKAEAIASEGRAEAEAIAAKGDAEAGAIKARGLALAEQSEMILAQDALKLLPIMVEKAADGYGNIDNLTMVSADGANRITADIMGTVKGATETVKAMTGIDVERLIGGAATGVVAGKVAAKTIAHSDAEAHTEGKG